ncbi:MAG: endonuclease/exonuclease/phosphatase family protein [Asticcacaulis sp.]
MSHASETHPDTLRLTTWNLGYAGLGAEADFVVDGGKMWRPVSRAHVQAHSRHISDWLKHQESDVFLLQEVSQGSLINRGVRLRAALTAALKAFSPRFCHDLYFHVLGLRFPLGHGLMTLSREAGEHRMLSLPSDGDIASAFVRKLYRSQVLTLKAPSGVRWVIFNIHLSAFDPEANLRRRQMRVVLEAAQAEYVRGARVIIGGDWNQRLAQYDLSHSTRPEDLEWLTDFDITALPEGWQIACDATTPSFRTNDQPYVEGENYEGIIDGFVCSPNVEVVKVQGHDLGFVDSDHNPVSALFRAL